MTLIPRKRMSSDLLDPEPREGSYNGVTSDGVFKFVAGSEISTMANLPIGANTLRFSFGDLNYDPTVAGVGSSGTWTKKNTKFTNVWDWTNTNISWATAFGGGNTTAPGAFADYENNPVKVIAAGDTSSVTDFSRFFQNCYAITEICPIDTSNSTTVFLMFSNCRNCTKFPDMDFSTATDTRAVYQYCYKMVSCPNIIFPADHNFSLQNMFYECTSLVSVPLFDTSSCTSMQAMFRNCVDLTTIPSFNTSNVTNMQGMLSCTLEGYSMHLESVPSFDYSACKNFMEFMGKNSEITEIPEMNIEASVTDVRFMYYGCPNVKSGQKALYDKLSAIGTITNHVGCFKDCGSATEEGRAELAQIPVSWGGTMVEP